MKKAEEAPRRRGQAREPTVPYNEVRGLRRRLAGSRGSDEPHRYPKGQGGDLYLDLYPISTLSSYPDPKLSDRGQVQVPSPIICAII